MALPGCALREKRGLDRKDLAAMVLPKEAMGAAYSDLELDEEDSGRVDNAELAKSNIDLDDTRDDVIRAGRIDGYAQTFEATRASGGLLAVSTSAELLRDAEAASAYLEDVLADFVRMKGRKDEGARLQRAKRFDVTGIGHEAGGVEVTVGRGKRRVYATAVLFRRGPIVADASLIRADRKGVRAEVERLARVLDNRVAGVLLGEELREPSPVAREFGPDLESLTLGAKDFRGISLVGEGYVTMGKARAFLREFDVNERLGSSRVFYLRTMTQAFPTRKAARKDQRYMGSAEGSRSLARRFLRQYFRETDYTPAGVEARPLSWRGGDTIGVQFFFEAPKGRMEGVMLSVHKGELLGNVMVMGAAKDVEPNDVLTVRKKLRARLASA